MRVLPHLMSTIDELCAGDISLELVFFPQETYSIAAGIGTFNASYISHVDESVSTALLVSMGSPTWSTRDTWPSDPLGPSYGHCTKSDGSWTACDESHLLVGGVLSISPQKDNLSVHPDSTAYVVPHTRSLLLEYGTVHDLQGLYNNGTCYLTGSAYAAAYWCTHTGSDQELLFGEAQQLVPRISSILPALGLFSGILTRFD